MKKLSALALAAALGLSGLAPFAVADAATAKKPVHHAMAKKSDLVCHMVKEKDGKMHKLCHHHHAKKAPAHKAAAKKTKKK